MKHPVKHLRFPKAAVEPVAKFSQITGQMLGANAVLDTSDIPFNIGDQGMDPRQDLRRFLPRARHQPFMMETGRRIQEAIALPAIGLNHRLGRQAFPDQGFNLFAADSGHHPHGGKSTVYRPGSPRLPPLGLASCATSTFAGFGSTEVNVIHLDQPSQFVIGIPLGHGLANLVAHGPDGLVTFNFQHPLQGQHRNAAFLSSHQPNHPEPFGQRGPGLVKHGASGQRGLITTGLTMV